MILRKALRRHLGRSVSARAAKDYPELLDYLARTYEPPAGEAMGAPHAHGEELASAPSPTPHGLSPVERAAAWGRGAEGGMAEGGLAEAEPLRPAVDAPTGAPPDAAASPIRSRVPSAPAPGTSPSVPTSHASSCASRATRPRRDLEDLLAHLDASFSQTLLAMIDARGLADAEVYRRANISRQHFSKIRNNPGYRPKKQTVLALAVALALTPDECRLLLERAGFALTHASRRDVIVEYYLQRGRPSILEVNQALYAFDEPLLGA